MKSTSLGFVVAIFAIVGNGEIRISLNSDNLEWKVQNGNKSINIPATVPGGIYTDLQIANVISSNLFYRFNDIDLRWIGRDNWIYTTHFNLSSEIVNKTAINLVLHGIDTVGSVHINGHLVALVSNMFVRYSFPVKNYVIEEENILEVKLKSPIVESKNLFQKHNYTVPPKCVPIHYNGECHINFLRKMQASFAWDWGPAFPSVGIWKPIEIEAFDSALLRDVTTSVEDFNGTTWKMNVTSYLETAVSNLGDYELIGRVFTENSTVEADSVEVAQEEEKFIARMQFCINKETVRLWWPNGFGAQPLYRLNVTFLSQNSSEISTRTLKIGFRTIELIQERIRPPKEGRTFYFRVNGVAIFAKGSNWIPSHILPELSYKENRVRSLLLSAKEAHMNMLRVWGGGLYESDLYYQIADELGLMIWQDMMFASAMYPTNEEFLENVRTETEQQVRRLQHHPSIVLWAGNNENEAALRGNWYGTGRNFELYKADYVKLYVGTIKPVLTANDKTRPFVVSSPSNGVKSQEEGYVAKDPYSPLYGDLHFYNYILDPWNSDTYQNTRFASEYGFQSLPSIITMTEVSLPSDRKLESQFSAKRQHLLAGYLLTSLLIKLRLPMPKRDDSEEYYKNFIYHSQITQAMGVKTETEKYRRDRNKLTKSNEGRTMGALYWQLNDVWQAPSWSSIDFNGRWKMLHYYAKKFFSPIIISPDLTIDNHVNVFIVSDILTDIPDAEMNVIVYAWNSFEPKKIITSKEQVRKNRSKIHARYDLPELMKESKCSESECFVYFALTAKKVNLAVDNILYPVSFNKVSNLQPSEIFIHIHNATESNELLIDLTASNISPFVWLETEEPGQFSDNGFTMITKTKKVTFSNRGDTIDVENFKKTLIARSLLL